MYSLRSVIIQVLTSFFCCVAIMDGRVSAQQFVAAKTSEGIEITENGKKVLFYQQSPKSLNGKYERAGYVHPLYSLNEKVLTDDFPEDHPYHHGIFWAWHQIVLNDKMIADGWTCESISWQPLDVKIKNEKELITLQSELLWKSVLSNQDTPTAIIKEDTKITVHKSTERYRVIDFDVHIAPLVNGLKIGGSDDVKGYGGFSLRLKLPQDISFVSNDTTVTPKETAVTTGPWMDITGSFAGAEFPKSGVTVFCNHPVAEGLQPWILRKVTSMQNVPFPGRTPVALPREGWRLKYRVIIHNADLSNEELEKLYQQYIHKS